jgi:hypothetical protein
MSGVIDVKVPDIGDFKDVPVIEIFVKPGDQVKAEDPLISLESDKATMDVPSPTRWNRWYLLHSHHQRAGSRNHGRVQRVLEAALARRQGIELEADTAAVAVVGSSAHRWRCCGGF